MAYATLDDLKLQLRSTTAGLYEQLTNRAGGQTGDDAIGALILERAESIINLRLAGRYATPIVSGDATTLLALKHLALAVATWVAWTDHPARSREKETIAKLREVWEELLDAAVKAGGLPGATALAAPTNSGPPAIAVGSERVFNDEAMKGF